MKSMNNFNWTLLLKLIFISIAQNIRSPYETSAMLKYSDVIHKYPPVAPIMSSSLPGKQYLKYSLKKTKNNILEYKINFYFLCTQFLYKIWNILHNQLIWNTDHQKIFQNHNFQLIILWNQIYMAKAIDGKYNDFHSTN